MFKSCTFRSIRLPLLSLLLVVFASCSDSQEMISPSSSITKVGPGAVAAVSDKNDDDGDGDELPENLNAVARYLAPSGSKGAQSVSLVIGPLGGSLRLGDFEMIVPAGAVSSATKFSIKTFPEGNKNKHAIASFMPHRTFAQPITLRVPLNSTESAGDIGAHVMWLDGSTWVELPSTVTPDGRLETKTLHFSCYGTQYRGFTLVGG